MIEYCQNAANIIKENRNKQEFEKGIFNHYYTVLAHLMMVLVSKKRSQENLINNLRYEAKRFIDSIDSLYSESIDPNYFIRIIIALAKIAVEINHMDETKAPTLDEIANLISSINWQPPATSKRKKEIHAENEWLVDLYLKLCTKYNEMPAQIVRIKKMVGGKFKSDSSIHYMLTYFFPNPAAPQEQDYANQTPNGSKIFADIVRHFNDDNKLVGRFFAICAYTSNSISLNYSKLSELSLMMSKLDRSVLDHVFTTIEKINPNKSSRLPTVQDFISFVHRAQNYTLAPDAAKKDIQKIFDTIFNQQNNGEIEIGFSEIEKLAEGPINPLRDVFQHDFSEENLKTTTDYFRWIPGFNLAEIINGVNDIRQRLSQADATTDVKLKEILNKSDDVEALFKSVLSGKMEWPITTAIQNFSSSSSEDSKKMVAELLGKKAVIIYVRRKLMKAYSSQLKRRCKELGLDKAITTVLINLLGDYDTKVKFSEAIKKFDANYTITYNFLNNFSLISRNSNPNDFVDICKLVSESFKNHHGKYLSIANYTRLIESVYKFKGIDYKAVFSKLFSAIDQRSQNVYASDPGGALDRALSQLEILQQFSQKLPIQLQNKFIPDIFSYNFLNNKGLDLSQLNAIIELPRTTKKSIRKEFANSLLENVLNFQATMLVKSPGACQAIMELLKRLTQNKSGLHLLLRIIENPDQTETAKDLIRLNTLSPDKLELVTKIAAGALLDRNYQFLTTNTNEKITNYADISPFLTRLIGTKDQNLQLLNSLYVFPPSPKAPQLNALDFNSDENIKKYTTKFDLDPFDIRQSIQAINDQFTMDRAGPVTNEIMHMLAKSKLSSSEQQELIREIVYINSVGHTCPFKIGSFENKALKNFSRAELNQALEVVKLDLKQSKQNLKTQLDLIALLREMYFRATKLMPYTTQLLPLLLSIHHPGNLLMQINTGEGKSIITAILATIQSITTGDSIDVQTANLDLMDKDYKENADFFAALGIESSIVRGTSPQETYKVGGINYTTKAEISLYRSKAKILNHDLSSKEDSAEKIGVSVIEDEVDYSLDIKTLFNLAMHGKDATGADNNQQTDPYDWLYRIIYRFVGKSAFQNIDVTSGAAVYIKPEDIRQLKADINASNLTAEQQKLYDTISTAKFHKWITGACIAKGLKEGINFVVQPTKDQRLYEIIPLNNNIPQNGSSFSDSVHQFLTIRLSEAEKDVKHNYDDTKHKNKPFAMEPEVHFVATESAKKNLEFYKKHGRIIGISGSVGNDAELRYMQGHFNCHALQIPPHFKKNLITKQERYAINAEQHLTAIQNEILESVNSGGNQGCQPILIICENAVKAKELHEKLAQLNSTNPALRFSLVVGEESSADRETKRKEAGLPNRITIATSIFSRGVDIIPDHPQGLFVLGSYIDAERNSIQIAGRAARNGKLGKFAAIYNNEDLIHNYKLDLTKHKPETHEALLKKLRIRMSAELAIERFYIQDVDSIKNVLLRHFKRYHKHILEGVTDSNQRVKINLALLKLREKLIDELSDEWDQILEHSDKKKEYSNLYLRYKNGQLDYNDLDACITEYTKSISDIWSKFKNNINKEFATKSEQLDYLNNVSIKTLINNRKLTEAGQISTSERAIAVADALSTEYLLDENAAYLHFNMLKETEDGLKEFDPYKEKSKLFQLERIIADLKRQPNLARFAPAAQQTLNKKAEGLDKNNPIALVDFMQDYHNACISIDDLLRIQPAMRSLKKLSDDYPTLLEVGKKRILDDSILKLAPRIENRIISSLRDSLAWSKSRFKCFFERRQIINSAKELYAKSENYLNNQSAENLKSLYQALEVHKLQLKSTWSLDLFHSNVVTQIKKCLAQLQSIATKECSTLSTKESLQLKEVGLFESHINHFKRGFEAEKANLDPSLTGFASEISTMIDSIASHKKFYCFYEIQNYLLNLRDTADKPKQLFISKLFTHFQNTFIEENDKKIYLSSDYYIQHKNNHFKQILKKAGNDIHLQAKHIGFKHYYEITAKMDHNANEAMLLDFGFEKIVNKVGNVTYQEQITKLEEESAQIDQAEKNTVTELANLTQAVLEMQDRHALSIEINELMLNVKALKAQVETASSESSDLNKKITDKNTELTNLNALLPNVVENIFSGLNSLIRKNPTDDSSKETKAKIATLMNELNELNKLQSEKNPLWGHAGIHANLQHKQPPLV